MRTLGRFMLALCLVAVLALPAITQQPRGGFGMFGGGGGAALLANKGVQTELKLTPEQVEKIGAYQKEQMEKGKDRFTSFKDLSQEERLEKFKAIAKESNDQLKKFTGEVLNAEQRKRFSQIELQNRRSMAFTDEEVVKKLSLTDDQKDKIKLINEDLQKDLQEARKSAGQNFQELLTKTPAIQKEAFERVVAVLKPEQKTAWKELTGEPFEVKMEAGRPGGRQKKDKDK